jgi:hypothetical protein
MNFTVITVLLWPSVFCLALVVVVVETKTLKNKITRKITAGTIEFGPLLSSCSLCYSFSFFSIDLDET